MRACSEACGGHRTVNYDDPNVERGVACAEGHPGGVEGPRELQPSVDGALQRGEDENGTSDRRLGMFGV